MLKIRTGCCNEKRMREGDDVFILFETCFNPLIFNFDCLLFFVFSCGSIKCFCFRIYIYFFSSPLVVVLNFFCFCRPNVNDFILCDDEGRVLEGGQTNFFVVCCFSYFHFLVIIIFLSLDCYWKSVYSQ